MFSPKLIIYQYYGITYSKLYFRLGVFMIKNLVKAAADLDRAGFHVEADLMDKIMQKVAEGLAEDNDNQFGFLGSAEDDSVDSDDVSEEEEEEEGEEEEEEEGEEEEGEEEEEGGALSAEECLEHCMMLSVDEKCALMKSLLDSLCE